MGHHRLKLLLVINHLHPSGGAETQLTHLAKGLAELGHRVTICCIDDWSVDPAALRAGGVELVALHARTRLGRSAAIPRLARLARSADVVQCTMWDASLWGRVAAILARRPVIVADHATDRSVQVARKGAPRATWIQRHNRLLDSFTFATVACAASQRPVLLDEGVSPQKIVHIPNGIPLRKFKRSYGKGVSRDDLGLPMGAPVTMQVGVFRKEKNQLGALEAVAAARERVGNIQLIFVGDGGMRAEVEARVREIGATEWTHFLGHREDVSSILRLADVMLLPSVADAMPMTVLESMSLGVPVLATKVGDVQQVLGDAGVCVPPGDVAEFSSALAELLSNDTRRARLGEHGKARAREFDVSLMTRRYSALFEAAASGDPLASAFAVPGRA